MVRLPVSQIDVLLRQPTGVEDILLLEAPAYDTACALELITRLALPRSGCAVKWETLVVTDLDALLLFLRQMIFGDLIRTDSVCPVQDCGVQIDISFRIGEYLAHHVPHAVRGVEQAEETGWFRLQNTPVSFRLPTVTDQIAVDQSTQPEEELLRSCVRPADISARLRKRLETAMEALAPSLSHELQGQCHACGATVDMYFDIQQFVLSELGNQATFLYEDVHLLASRYHWTQAEILSLPRSRRARYTAMLQQERSLV